MWHPPEFSYDGLAVDTRLPRQSTPPDRSGRSKMADSEAVKVEVRRFSGAAPNLDLAKLVHPQVSRPTSAIAAAMPNAMPCGNRALGAVFPRDGLSASQCLAEELRPSTPPRQPRRSNLRRAQWVNEKLQGADDTPSSDSATMAASVVSTVADSPVVKVSGYPVGAAAAPLSPEEESQVEPAGVHFEGSEPGRIGSSSERQAQRDRAKTSESYFSEQDETHEGRGRGSLNVPGVLRRRSDTGSGVPGTGAGRFSKRTSIAPSDILEADLFSPTAKCNALDETSPSSEESSDDSDESEDEEDEKPCLESCSFQDPTDGSVLSVVQQRRGGVSAEARGGWNQLLSNRVPRSEPKKPAERKQLWDALRQCPFTQSVDEGCLASLVEAIPVQSYQPGELLCKQDAQGDCAYVLLRGTVSVFKESGDGEKVFVRSLTAGRLFGEFSMLWNTPRSRSVYVDENSPATIGILSREDFQDLVVRSEMKERSRREACLRRSAMLETLSDEQISQLADALMTKVFDSGEDIVKQGDNGDEFYVILEGTCVVEVQTGKDDVQEHRRCHAGDMLGEKALLEKTRRSATVRAVTKVEVLLLKRAAFERMLGPLSQLQEINYLCDPRRSIANFYQPGTTKGPAGVSESGGEDTEWFAVYRPTSRDAIAKMLSGVAVGKGLNVKGKSAKLNRLSGFVPFLQISQESDKADVTPSPPESRITIYFGSEELRRRASGQLQSYMDSEGLDIEDRRIIPLDGYPATPGLNVPEPLLRYAFIDKPDIQPAVGWETGRISSPAFMDMNLQAVRGDSKPKVVLFQYDQDNAMNPHGLLIAYAESTVKPVVSDFDTFTVGSRGMAYSRLPQDQADLAMWALKHTEQLLRKPSPSSWTSRWLEVLKEAHEAGFHPDIPEYGFGDATSYRLIEGIVDATSESGAVRHGAECFNFYFPQELDENFLVVWEGFCEGHDDKPWAYMDECELRKFLEKRVEEHYAMPLNPIWCVRDDGWYQVLEAQMANPSCAEALKAWYPDGSGILEKIQELNKEFPQGLLPADQVGRELRSTLSTVTDLDTCEKATLASTLATAGKKRWGAAFRKVTLMQSMSRQSFLPPPQ